VPLNLVVKEETEAKRLPNQQSNKEFQYISEHRRVKLVFYRLESELMTVKTI
jgi:hypothetical protein